MYLTISQIFQGDPHRDPPTFHGSEYRNVVCSTNILATVNYFLEIENYTRKRLSFDTIIESRVFATSAYRQKLALV